MPNTYPDPVPRRAMRTEKFKGTVCICEYIRDTYKLTNQRDIRARLRVIMAMGQAMNARLNEYKAAFDILKKASGEIVSKLDKVPEDVYGKPKN
jgi:hypothetical protein